MENSAENLSKAMIKGVLNIICVLILLLSVLYITRYCGTHNNAKDNYEDLYNKESAKVDSLYRLRLKEKDSLQKLIDNRNRENILLTEEKEDLKKTIKSIYNKENYKPITLVASMEYLSDRYDTDSLSVEDNRLKVDFETSLNIISELEDKDKLEDVTLLQQEIINNDSLIINNLNNNFLDLKMQLLAAEEDVNRRINLDLLAQDSIHTLQNKLDKRSKLLKILVPVALVKGFIVGVLVSK